MSILSCFFPLLTMTGNHFECALAYLTCCLYQQGSLLNAESWFFRPCGRSPTLAFRGGARGAGTASSATEKRLEGPVSCCGCRSRFNSRASHALAYAACENPRDSSHFAGARSRASTKGSRFR